MFERLMMKIKNLFKAGKKDEKGVKEINPSHQFNGMILLHGYLQRLFVFEKIHAQVTVNEQKENKLTKLLSLLDSLGGMLQQFEQTKHLTEPQINDGLSILNEVQQMMGDYLSSAATFANFEEKLAIAGSTIYAEEHINNGVIKMGELFNPEIQDRYMQQIPYHRNRVALVNQVVHKTLNNEPILTEEAVQIEQWYEDVIRNKEGIQSDFHTIRTFLAA